MVASRRLHRRRGLAAPRLNPLHCGAVVASAAQRGGAPRRRRVSIPFIAGQWSLLDAAPVASPDPAKSQSPSLRGSGRFPMRRRSLSACATCLNPLHCGAVVASRRRGAPGPPCGACLNPLHCGAVVASPKRGRARKPKRRVSIPFIAGQWSLHGTPPSPEGGRAMSQSPSLRGSGRFPRSTSST